MSDLHAVCLASIDAATAKAAADIDATIAKAVAQIKSELATNQEQLKTIMSSLPAPVNETDTIEYIDAAAAKIMFDSCPVKVRQDLIIFATLHLITGEYLIFQYGKLCHTHATNNPFNYGVQLNTRYVDILFTNMGTVFHSSSTELKVGNKYNVIIPKSFDIDHFNRACEACFNNGHTREPIWTIYYAFEIYCKGIKSSASKSIAIYDAETTKLKTQQEEVAAESVALKAKYDKLTADLHSDIAAKQAALDATNEKQNARLKVLDAKEAKVNTRAKENHQTYASQCKELDNERVKLNKAAEENIKMRTRLENKEKGINVRESLNDLYVRVTTVAHELIDATSLLDYDTVGAIDQIKSMLQSCNGDNPPPAQSLAQSTVAMAVLCDN